MWVAYFLEHFIKRECMHWSSPWANCPTLRPPTLYRDRIPKKPTFGRRFGRQVFSQIQGVMECTWQLFQQVGHLNLRNGIRLPSQFSVNYHYPSLSRHLYIHLSIHPSFYLPQRRIITVEKVVEVPQVITKERSDSRFLGIGSSWSSVMKMGESKMKDFRNSLWSPILSRLLVPCWIWRDDVHPIVVPPFSQGSTSRAIKLHTDHVMRVGDHFLFHMSFSFRFKMDWHHLTRMVLVARFKMENPPPLRIFLPC